MSKLKMLESMIKRIVEEEKYKSFSPGGSFKEVQKLKSELDVELKLIDKLKFQKSTLQWKLDNIKDEYDDIMADMEQDPEFDVDSGEGSSFGSKNYHGRKLKQYQDKEAKYSNAIGAIDAQIEEKSSKISDIRRRLGNFPTTPPSQQKKVTKGMHVPSWKRR